MTAIFNSTTLDSAILHKINFTHSFWLKLDDGSHLEFCHLGFRHYHVGFRHCHLGFRHLVISLRFTQKHSHSTLPLTQTNLISLIWWRQPSWILPSWILPFCTKLWLKLIHSHSTWWCQPPSILPSWIQLWFNQKTSLIHSGSSWWWQPSWNLAMLDSATAILDSDTLLSSLRFTQKHSHSTLTLTQTNSIWLKLIHSHLTWWCQPSWIWQSWIQLS